MSRAVWCNRGHPGQRCNNTGSSYEPSVEQKTCNSKTKELDSLSRPHVARTQAMLEKTSPSLWGNDQNIYNKNSRNWNLLRCTNAKKIAPGTPNNQLKWMFGETTISILLPVTLEELFRPFCSLSDEITGPRWWRENRMFIHFLFYLCLLKKCLSRAFDYLL